MFFVLYFFYAVFNFHAMLLLCYLLHSKLFYFGVVMLSVSLIRFDLTPSVRSRDDVFIFLIFYCLRGAGRASHNNNNINRNELHQRALHLAQCTSFLIAFVF